LHLAGAGSVLMVDALLDGADASVMAEVATIVLTLWSLRSSGGGQDHSPNVGRRTKGTEPRRQELTENTRVPYKVLAGPWRARS
jgi:hypothetical protein